jgi:hypothetical protein
LLAFAAGLAGAFAAGLAGAFAFLGAGLAFGLAIIFFAEAILQPQLLQYLPFITVPQLGQVP